MATFRQSPWSAGCQHRFGSLGLRGYGRLIVSEFLSVVNSRFFQRVDHRQLRNPTKVRRVAGDQFQPMNQGCRGNQGVSQRHLSLASQANRLVQNRSRQRENVGGGEERFQLVAV